MLVANGSIRAYPVKMSQKYVIFADINLLPSDFLFKPVVRSHGIEKLIYNTKRLVTLLQGKSLCLGLKR